jgi:hypothetical protein
MTAVCTVAETAHGCCGFRWHRTARFAIDLMAVVVVLLLLEPLLLLLLLLLGQVLV